MQLRTGLEPHRQAQAGDVHELQLAQVEHHRTVAVLQDGVHVAFERGHGRAVEFTVHLDERGLSDTLQCGAEPFYAGHGSAVRRVVLGPGAKVHRSARIEVARGARVILGPGVVIGPDVRIAAHGGTVKVGAGAWVGERAIIVSRAGVEIGEHAVIGDWAAIEDAAPTFADVERPINAQPALTGLVRVGARARIGTHAVLGAGTEVPAGGTVAPYAVVRDATSRS